MKIVYKSIVDDILDAHTAALKEGRTIKEVVLSRSEWRELCMEVPIYYEGSPKSGEVVGKFSGLTIRIS